MDGKGKEKPLGIHIRQTRHPSRIHLLLKNRRRVTRAIYQIAKMVLQCLFIVFLVHVFEDFNYNGRVAGVVEVYFLVVWDLADLAATEVSY